MNAVFFAAVCLTGTLAWIIWLVPLEAGMAIVVWIGLIIAAQAFQATPRRHAPAVVVGMLPSIGAWGALMAKDGLRVSGTTFFDGLVEKFQSAGTFIDGAFALEQGFIFSSMILASITVYLIDRKFVRAAIWSVIAAGLCAVSLMHSFRLTGPDAVSAFGQSAWSWVIGYLVMAAVFVLAKWITVPLPETTSGVSPERERDRVSQ